ncbi:MAG: TolC family protein [Planctomycetaceae bacterium]|nr:TolC family protein [Planctomycetaceae bacterium]
MSASFVRSLIVGSIVLLSAASITTAAEDAAAGSVPPEPIAESALSLEALVAIAESSSPNLGQAAAEVEMARGRARQAGLYPNPIASGGAMQLGGRDSQYYGQLSQEIVTRRKLQLDQAAVCREVFQAESRYIRVRFELLTAVRIGYFNVLVGQKRVDVLGQLVEIARKSESAAERLQAAGEGTRSDTILLQLELEKAEVALENAEAILSAARRQLAAEMGSRDLQIGRVEGDVLTSLETFAAQVLVDGYVPYNADVTVAELEVDRNRLLLQRARVQPYPNVTINAGYMREYRGLDNIALLNVEVPLPVWNKNQGNIYAAQAGVSRAAQNVAQVQNTIAQQVADAQGRYRAADQNCQRYEKRIVPLAREGVQLIQQGFQQGQFDFLRLLQAQRALVEAQLGYLNALETRWLTAAELGSLAQVEAFP